MASLKLYYKLGVIGSLIVILIGVAVIFLHQLTSYISFFGTVSMGADVVTNMVFGVVALLGTEISRRKRDVGLTAMTVISFAGILAYPGIFTIGYIVVLIAVLIAFIKK
ncbi:hypothetical protein ACNF42_00210 [Cuniculiplasma sp. SKW3]|uniref:hypothetical protein n=1 Tax=Cuniculiplasma sp. SKW3 TaxID=3400170 RepID=UPI003FD1E4DF